MLWRYFVGLIAVITYTTVVASVPFNLVFHIPHAPMLSIAVGLLELVPVIGPAVTLGLIGLSAVQQTSVQGMVGLAAFAIALRLSIDQIVGPLVLGRAAQLHPVVIIFAFLTEAALFGIIGLLLAVPFAAAIKIVLMMYYAEPVQNRTPPPPSSRIAKTQGRRNMIDALFHRAGRTRRRLFPLQRPAACRLKYLKSRMRPGAPKSPGVACRE